MPPASAATKPKVAGFFHPPTSSVSYVVACAATGEAAVIDAVLDYDPAGARTGTDAADALIAHVRKEGLKVAWVLDTHVHADHLTATPHVRRALGGATAIGEHLRAVQSNFAALFGPGDTAGFDRLFADGETFRIGALEAHVMHTPGHTPACVTYAIGDAAFCGDTLFMPDYGTARCDFPGGDAGQLFRSIRRILSLPAATRIFVGHDYQPDGRAVAFETTVAAQRAGNLHVRDGVDESAFVAMRTARDKTLTPPTLIWPSLQVNLRAGRLPEPAANGVRYLRIPLDRL